MKETKNKNTLLAEWKLIWYYTVILMQGATRENQHVEVWYVYIIGNKNNMLTFLTLVLHMILYGAAAACMIEVVDEEE